MFIYWFFFRLCVQNSNYFNSPKCCEHLIVCMLNAYLNCCYCIFYFFACSTFRNQSGRMRLTQAATASGNFLNNRSYEFIMRLLINEWKFAMANKCDGWLRGISMYTIEFEWKQLASRPNIYFIHWALRP